jgi:DDE family transposase
LILFPSSLSGEVPAVLAIWASFADLPDPRTGNAQRHNLLDVLTIALTATICGAESCVDFADFARDREALYREFLELPGGLPSQSDKRDQLLRIYDELDDIRKQELLRIGMELLRSKSTCSLCAVIWPLDRMHRRWRR